MKSLINKRTRWTKNTRPQPTFKESYRDLEQRVLRELRDKVENSKITSIHVNEKAIKVNVFDYTELVLINDRLTFLDAKGLHYSVFADASLEDLIDILKVN